MFDDSLIKKLKELPTPFYYYDPMLLKQNLERLIKAAAKYGFKIHYALKANANLRILKLISGFGLGADCVSGNEIKRALDTGFPAGEIVFAGVGKTDREIVFGLENNLHSFNCESLQELEVINGLALQKGKKASVALRINPNLDAGTHHYITTGREENKFGINFSDLPVALQILKKSPGLQLIGIHFHVGSQITNLEVFKNLCLTANDVVQWFQEQGMIFSHLNMGGGLGIDYHNPDEGVFPDYDTYFRIFQEHLRVQPGQTVHFELGRSIVGQCGSLVCRVLYVKKSGSTNFVICDTGMTELIRPALYHAYHKVENLAAVGKSIRYDVVGPVCESSDYLGKNIMLPETKRGDLLAIRSTGAYAEVMAMHYNLRDLVRAVYSDEI